ncbi:hypothetical protein KP509_09G052800 [Ceratopteris richardii]|nr:hypothetical protein KP509_09G052800 [Ceratopteris richardii]
MVVPQRFLMNGDPYNRLAAFVDSKPRPSSKPLLISSADLIRHTHLSIFHPVPRCANPASTPLAIAPAITA